MIIHVFYINASKKLHRKMSGEYENKLHIPAAPVMAVEMNL